MIDKLIEKTFYFSGLTVGTYLSPLLIGNEPTLKKIGDCMGMFYRLVRLKINNPEMNNEVRIRTKENCWFFNLANPPYKVCRTLFEFDIGLVDGFGKKRYKHDLTKSLALGHKCCEFCTREQKSI